MALIAQAATLRTRVPFLHFFDGFRTSHEVAKIELLTDDDLRAMIDDELVRAHRGRALSPDHPVHPRHGAEPGRLLPGARDGQPVLRAPARHRAGRDGPARRALTGRQYRLFDYVGAPDAERVIVVMGSGAETVARDRRLPDRARREGRRAEGPAVPAVLGASTSSTRCPPTVRAIAVLDRTKEPGAIGEPLYLDVVTALAEAARRRRARRHAARRRRPLRPVVEGVHAGDGHRRSSTSWRASQPKKPLHRRHRRRRDAHQPAVRPGVRHRAARRRCARCSSAWASDGTVGANKNSIKIIGEETGPARAGLLRLRLEEVGLDDDLAPALRPAADPLAVSDQQANFVGCHQFDFWSGSTCSAAAAPGATFLLNSPLRARTRSGTRCRARCRSRSSTRSSTFYVDRRRPGRPRGRAWAAASTPSCRPASSPSPACCRATRRSPRIKKAIEKTYGKRGDDGRRAQLRGRRRSRSTHLHEVTVPDAATATPRAAAAGARRRARLRPQRDRA